MIAWVVDGWGPGYCLLNSITLPQNQFAKVSSHIIYPHLLVESICPIGCGIPAPQHQQRPFLYRGKPYVC